MKKRIEGNKRWMDVTGDIEIIEEAGKDLVSFVGEGEFHPLLESCGTLPLDFRFKKFQFPGSKRWVITVERLIPIGQRRTR